MNFRHVIFVSLVTVLVCTLLFFNMSSSVERPNAARDLQLQQQEYSQRVRQQLAKASQRQDRANAGDNSDGVVQETTLHTANANKPSNDALQTISSSRLCVEKSYYDFVSHLLVEHFGHETTAALYDEEMFNYLSRAAAAGSLGDDDSFVWHISKLRSPPVSPTSFSKPSNILRMAKRLLSVAVGRVHRDKEMENLYQHTCGNDAAATVFRRGVRRVLESYLNYFYTLMQLALDALDGKQRRVWRELSSVLPPAKHGDLLTTLMTLISTDTTNDEVDSLLSLGLDNLREKLASTRKRFNTASASSFEIQALFPLDYTADVYDSQRPVNGKFWNMIRPTASCTSLVRLCEKPDGCRLLCNAEYLLRAGNASYYHRLAGFGSNNEYDWETSLAKMFDAASQSASHGTAKANKIGWFSVFDCTLGAGSRAWAPPDYLVQSEIGFGYASKCLDGHPSETSYSLKDLKQVLLSSEAATRAEKAHDAITRRSVSSSALAASSNRHQELHPPLRGNHAAVRYFDGVSILKIDVEGYEFNTVPAWARDELRNIGASSSEAVLKGNKAMIDFEVAASDYFSVSLLSMEFHRAGHRYNHAAALRGALRAHYTLLHIYSLGFVLAGQEKNHQDNCCYELVWVHYRHFVRSEVWMAVGDSL